MSTTFLDRANWMSHLNLNTKILASYIPASHDSSCYPTDNVFEMFKNNWVGAVTQLASYTSQLNVGVRYFDMRVKMHKNQLTMHHSDYYYDAFTDVLGQIVRFADEHRGEFIFMDIDFPTDDPNVANGILQQIEEKIAPSRIATAHLNADGTFNRNVTWRDLGGKQFLITWALNDTKGRNWLSYVNNFRISPFDNFNLKTPDGILSYLKNAMLMWSKDRIFIAQVINTPYHSFESYDSPANCDARAETQFNNWIMSHGKGSKLNVIMRDFVNAGYNAKVIDYIIRLNNFASDPTITLRTPIHQEDWIRLRTDGGQYVSLGRDNLLTLVGTYDNSCKFQLRDYDYNTTKLLPYSGNLNADTIDSKGNFRMLVRDNKVISVDTNQRNRLYFGIGWGPSGNNETFTGFNPENLSDGGQIYDGSRINIRSMLGASSVVFEKIVKATAETIVGLNPLLGSSLVKAMFQSSGNHLFLTVTYDASGKAYINAASPGTSFATTFILEKVS